jgi:cytochrome c
LAAGGCAGESSPGEAVFREARPDGNTFTCDTCHSLEEDANGMASDGFRRPGHPLGDAVARPSYKNGRVDTLVEAVNSCLVEWMNAEPFADENDPDFVALRSFLSEQAPESAEPLSFEIVPPPPLAELSGGTVDAGEATFNRSCAVCHGEGGGGTQQAPPVAGRMLAPELIAERVRLSGLSTSLVYDGLTGGRMPFWAADRFSDQELRDVITWLAVAEAPDPTTGGDSGDATTGGERVCDATHAKVGWRATLQDFFHGVGGVAEIVDDCTVEIRMFNFDGGGIDTQIYGGIGSDYANGYSMSENLVRADPWVDETLLVQLPEGESLDDLDGVSVWCVPVGVDFGSGTFAP